MLPTKINFSKEKKKMFLFLNFLTVPLCGQHFPCFKNIFFSFLCSFSTCHCHRLCSHVIKCSLHSAHTHTYIRVSLFTVGPILVHLLLCTCRKFSQWKREREWAGGGREGKLNFVTSLYWKSLSGYMRKGNGNLGRGKRGGGRAEEGSEGPTVDSPNLIIIEIFHSLI